MTSWPLQTRRGPPRRRERGFDAQAAALALVALAVDDADVAAADVAKVEHVQRDLTYLRPEVVLVVDRVVTVGDAGPPRFVLHLPARPDFGPYRVVQGIETDGILAGESQLALVANGTGGHMAIRTLWPGATRTTAIGGPGYRYWVDGANRDGGAEAHEQQLAEPGAWRIEVVPATGLGSPDAASHLMVHALAVGDAAAVVREQAADMRVLDASGDPAAGPTGMVVAIDDEARGTARIALRSRAAEGAGEAWAALCATPAPSTSTATATAGPEATATGTAAAMGTASASPYPTGHYVRLPFLSRP